MNILNILCVGNKSPMQRGFFNKKKKLKRLPVLRFLGGLCNFGNF